MNSQTKQITYKPLFLEPNLQKKVDHKKYITWRKFLIFLLLLILLHIIAIIDIIFNLRLPLVYIVPIYLFVSFIVAYTIDIKKINKYVNEAIKEQLTARASLHFDFEAIWKNPKKAKLAKDLTRLCIEYFNWNDNSVFFPDDPLTLMTTDECSSVDFLTKLKEKYSMNMIHYFWKYNGFDNLKFRDIIDYIIEPTPGTPKFRRKRLKGIASGLVGKFTSRNNNINGYWALGILYKITNDSGRDKFKLDLLSADSAPYWKGSDELTVKYKNFIIEQLGKNGFRRIHISKAIIEIDFNTSPPSTHRIKKCTWGEVYCCRAIITDYLHKEHLYESYGYCGIHDSKKETNNSC